MHSRWLGCLLAIAAAACGGADDGGSASLPGSPGGLSGGPGGIAAGIADSGAPVVEATGGTVGLPGTTAGGAVGGSVGATVNGLPCDVQAVFQSKCQTCHGSPLMSGPMPLITWADLQAASTAKPGQKIWQRVQARIADKLNPMPPAARPVLTAAETATLNAYLSAGAQKSTATTCTTTPVTLGGGATGGGAAGGGTASGAAGGTTGGGGMAVGVGNQQCDVVMEVRAHGGTSPTDTTPFSAPAGGDHYEIFWFTPTWTEKMQVIDIQPITDNGSVLHHWLLYQKASGTEANGSHNSDSGLQSSDSALLSGWAPGNKSFDFGTDLGLQTVQGPNGRYGIEIHYNTGANPPNRQDRSGARLCLTKKLRPKEGSSHWLGTQAIAGVGMFTADGTCTVQQESHIVAISPHMHKTGVHMTSIITKKAGGMLTLNDKPFSFNDQQIYPVDSPTGEVVVEPGDVINTTCTYNSDGFITFGPGTGDEMCYNFVYAWPAGSLSNGLPGLVGGENTCIDGIL